MRPEDLGYDLSRISQASRLITRIRIASDIDDIDAFIAACNRFLEAYRNDTADVLFSPFKGNRKDGQRRRRLDYRSARAILETIYRSRPRSLSN